MGRNYVAWALIEGNQQDGYIVERHGMMYPPEIGDTFSFGRGLTLWSGFFLTFLREDLQADAAAAERFVKMKGGAGASAEDINLRIAGMVSPGTWLVRNVDWKTWFKRNVHPEGAPAFFSMPTEHEADAAGIAFYLASVVLPRSRLFHPQP
jgi:hypothetical protein